MGVAARRALWASVAVISLATSVTGIAVAMSRETTSRPTAGRPAQAGPQDSVAAQARAAQRAARQAQHAADIAQTWTPVASYDFGGARVGPGWAIYDSSYGGDPRARVPSEVSVSDGMLHVATHGAIGSGLCLCNGRSRPTRPYGRWDIRARVTADPDHGFAILMWPQTTPWPAGGEVDIAEFNSARSRVMFTVHYSAANIQSRFFQGGDFTQWHTYSLRWTPTSLTYWIDGRLLHAVHNSAAIPHTVMHLALQAGPQGKHPSNTAADMQVDWVHVYR